MYQSAEAQEPIHNPWSGVKSFVDNSATNQRQGETIAQQATDISNLGGQYTTLQGNAVCRPVTVMEDLTNENEKKYE